MLDADVANDKPGMATLRGLNIKQKTFVVRSARGGLHVYFNGPGTSQRDLGPGLNVRSTGGYVCGPGSVFEGGTYTVVWDVPLVDLPNEIRGRLQAATSIKLAVDADLDHPSTVAIAVTQVKAEPGVDEGSRGSTAYRIALGLKDLGISQEVTRDILDEHWAPRCKDCDPAFYHPEISHAYQYGQNSPG